MIDAGLGGSFTQTHHADTLSGWKLHVYCPSTEAVKTALARLWDDADQYGWGMKAATARFFAKHSDGPQAGKGITIYLPHRDSVEDEIAWIEKLLDGYPFAGEIAGDDMVSPYLGRRFDLYADPGRDLSPREYGEWYKPSDAYLADFAAKAAAQLEAERARAGTFFGPSGSVAVEIVPGLDGDNELLARRLVSATTPLTQNTLYEKWQELHGSGEREGYEHVHLCARYSYAIPDEGALDLLAAQGPLVEIGAGAGYWTALLRERGADVVAYDQTPPAGQFNGGKRNIYTDMLQWADINVGDETAAADHPERALFLCWPPYEDGMATRALDAYQGEKVCYVGEWNAACAEPSFFAALKDRFECVERYDIPCWAGRHDNLTVWQRKPV